MNTMNQNGSFLSSLKGEVDLQPVMRLVYLWMGLGTLLTAAVAFVTVNSPLINLAAPQRWANVELD